MMLRFRSTRRRLLGPELDTVGMPDRGVDRQSALGNIERGKGRVEGGDLLCTAKVQLGYQRDQNAIVKAALPLACGPCS